MGETTTDPGPGDVTRRNSNHPPLGRPTPASNDDFFEPDELAELREYIAPLRRLRYIRKTIVYLVDIVVIFILDLPPEITGWVDDQGWFVRLAVVAAVLGVIDTVVSAPFNAWVNLVYEKRAGHSTMTVGTWIKDQVQNFVLGLLIGVILLGIVYAAMHTFDLWWLIGGAAIIVFFVTLQFVAPVLIMPRFNKFTPLEPGPIRTRIEQIAEMAGVEIEGVYLMDVSKRTTRANAGVTGFGKTKRVIINDTICEYPIEQLSQVIAHELGHYRLNHIVQSMPLSVMQFPVALAFIALVGSNDTVLGWAGVSELGDPASFGLLTLLFGVPMTLFSLPENWLSRKHEREADLEALELLGDPTSFVQVWPEMVLTDKANLEPTIFERLNSTHPEIAERMQFGIDWAELNGVPYEPPPRRSVPEAAGQPD